LREGLYRGAAHNRCNRQYYNKPVVPVFLHNGMKYDFHFIAMALSRHPAKLDMEVLGSSMENYILLKWGPNLVFKDSIKFIRGSLDSSVERLKKSQVAGQPSRFTNFDSEFSAKPQLRDLLLRKGVFPYDHFNDIAKLQDAQLPPIEGFYNSLRDKAISQADYDHAKKARFLHLLS